MLRGYRLTRAALKACDVRVWVGLSGVPWSVNARLVSHASFFVLSRGPEPGINALIESLSREFGVESYWDVGANFGYYGWLVKSFSPNARIRMFEPDPANNLLVRATLSRTRLDNVTIREVAVSDHAGTTMFMRDEVSGLTGAIAANDETFSQRRWGVTGNRITVETVRLDDERRDAGHVDLLKIDVEGHEGAVLKGAMTTMRLDRPFVIFECFHHGAEMIELLKTLDYDFADAERASDVTPLTTNFVAVPAQHRKRFNSLIDVWRARF